MLGTRGVPARYGGFETAVEEIGARMVEAGLDVTVYCRNPGQRIAVHRGMRLVNLPALRVPAAETLSHTGLSTVRAIARDRPDVAFVFNAANAPYLRALRAAGIATAVNPDGLEYERAKWQGLGAAYFRRAFPQAARAADVVIADAAGIASHLRATTGIEAVVIPYGADIVERDDSRLAPLGIRPEGYHLVVSRLVPENHVVEMLRGYAASRAELPLLVVGDPEPGVAYAREVAAAASTDERIVTLGPIWDQRLLDALYAGAASHLHGHSVGGTNPSLLRGMGAGAPITAHDNVFTREVTGGHARFFTTEQGVAAAVEADEADPAVARARGERGRERVRTEYRWDDVAARYTAVARELAARSRPTGRRGRAT